MKKTVKILALCLCVLCFTALFAGCDVIDDMQYNHALLSADKETITFRGETYRLLENADNLFVAPDYGYLSEDSIAVTDEDVPVLLSETLRHEANYDKERDLIEVYYNGEYGGFNLIYGAYYVTVGTGIYCNSKDYDNYTEALKTATLDRIGLEYETYKTEGVFSFVLEALSKEASDEIFNHIKNPDSLTEEIFDKAYFEDSLSFSMCKCDENAIIFEMIDGYDICRDSELNVYLLDYNTEKGVKLSESTAKEFKDEYFYGFVTSDTAVMEGAEVENEIVFVD